MAIHQQNHIQQAIPREALKQLFQTVHQHTQRHPFVNVRSVESTLQEEHEYKAPGGSDERWEREREEFQFNNASKIMT